MAAAGARLCPLQAHERRAKLCLWQRRYVLAASNHARTVRNGVQNDGEQRLSGGRAAVERPERRFRFLRIAGLSASEGGGQPLDGGQ